MSLINTLGLMQATAMRHDAQYNMMMGNQARINAISAIGPNSNMESLHRMDKQMSMQQLQNKMLIQMADAFEKNHRAKTKKAEGFDTFA